MNALHRSEINNDAVIAQTKARDVMAGTQNRGRNLVLACKLYGGDHIGDAGTACDESGMPVNHGIVDLTRFVITALARTKHLAAPRSLETFNHCLCNHLPTPT